MPIYPEVKRDWPSQPLLPAVPGWRNAADFFRGEALVELPLGVLRLGGSGRLEWLNNVTTQEVANLEPGTSTEALTLDPAGHIDLAFYIYEDAEHTWLFTEEPQASREFLQAMRFRAQVDIEDLSSSLRTLGFLEFPGKKSPLQAKLDPLSQAQFSDPWPGPVGNTTTYTAHLQTHPGGLDGGRRRIVAVTTRTFDEILDEGGVKWADFALWEADRVMRWRPRLGREGMPGVLPHEIDWLRSAVALEKGCYTGQETVAKLVNRGRPPRRLVFLDLDGCSRGRDSARRHRGKGRCLDFGGAPPPGGSHRFGAGVPTTRPAGRFTGGRNACRPDPGGGPQRRQPQTHGFRCFGRGIESAGPRGQRSVPGGQYRGEISFRKV